jgi:hypothetical protein
MLTRSAPLWNFKRGLKVGALGVFVLVLLFTVVVLSRDTGPISGQEFARLMAKEHIENAAICGYQLNGCGRHDVADPAFTGTRGGILVTGIICPGVLKAYTVRYDP